MRHSVLCIVLLCSAPAAGAVRIYERFRPPTAQLDRMTSAAYQSCQRAPEATSTYGMRACIWAEQRRLHARLDAAYRRAMARLTSASAHARLAYLERRWLATRSQECRRRYEHGEGTLSLIAEDMCGVMELARRLAWLERYGRRR